MIPKPFFDPDYPVTTLQSDWELRRVLEIFKKLSPTRIIEIGCEFGGTLYQWLKHAPPKSTIVVVDIMPVSPYFHSFAKKFDQNLHIIAGDSNNSQTVETVRGILPSVQFLLIDGDHHYSFTKKDWELWHPLVEPGGIIMFHDIAAIGPNPDNCAREFWLELKNSTHHKTEEIIENPEQTHYGTGLVYIE